MKKQLDGKMKRKTDRREQSWSCLAICNKKRKVRIIFAVLAKLGEMCIVKDN